MSPIVPGRFVFGLMIPIPLRIRGITGPWLFGAVLGPDFRGDVALELLVKRGIFRLVEFGHEVDPGSVLDPTDGLDEILVIDVLWILLVFHHEGDAAPLSAFASQHHDFVKVGGNGNVVFADGLDCEMPGGSVRIVLLGIIEHGTGDNVGFTATYSPAANNLLKLSPGVLVELADLRDHV